MIKALKKFILKIGLIVLVIVIGLAYLGFVPGLSNLFGSNRPGDLQVAPTATDLVSAQKKLDQVLITDSAPSLKVIRNGGTARADVQLTGRELAAHLEAIHPVKNLQIVFHADQTFEATGRIDKSRILKYVKLLGYTKVGDVDVLKAISTYLPGSPSFYLRGQGAITNGVPTMTITAAKIGRLPASGAGVAKALVDYAKLNLEKVPGLELTTMSIGGETISLIGTVPAVVPKL